MKPRKVKHLDPAGPLADNLARIVMVRADEVYALAGKAVDPAQLVALHDLRIAVKRLRYVLELGDGCFGPYAKTARRRARDLQDLIGEIHDADVALPRVAALLDALAQQDALALAAAADHAAPLDPALAAAAPHADAWRGLVTLGIHLRAQRALGFERFLALWQRTTAEDLRGRLASAVHERPIVLTPSSHDNGAQPLEQTQT